MSSNTELTAAECRWVCNPDDLGFSSTEGITADQRILGQEEAVEALQFGLKNRFRGDNVFVRGLSGFGRMALIHQTIREIATQPVDIPDHCYVHNFDEPDKPKLITLPAGRGREFREAMEEFADFAQTELPAYLSSDIVRSKQKQLAENTQHELQQLAAPLEQKLKEAGLTLIPMQVGQNIVPMILPVIDGNPVSFEELQKRRYEDELSEAAFQELITKIGSFEQEMTELSEKMTGVQLVQEENLRTLFADEAHRYVSNRISLIRRRFTLPSVDEFLDQILGDLVHRRLYSDAEDVSRLYRVNLVSIHHGSNTPPIVSVTNPKLVNLVGSIDAEMIPGTAMSKSDHLMIKPGALLEANGGFLIVEAREIISEPGAWSILLRTLKTGMLELTQLDPFGFMTMSRLKPAAIPIDIKVILVGDPETHYLLDQYEPRFADLFKVLADFSDTIERDANGYMTYGNMLARLVERDELKHFSNGAVAATIEHGARICSQRNRLTSRFGRIADIAREASFIADSEGRDLVSADDIHNSVRRSKDRANLPSRRFQRLTREGTVHIETTGEVVGQVNGLAVTSAGPLVYGFPTRITATMGPGNAGMINIERESELSGAIHTKGFMILSGLLRHVLKLDHPMAFSSSIGG